MRSDEHLREWDAVPTKPEEPVPMAELVKDRTRRANITSPHCPHCGKKDTHDGDSKNR